MHSYHATSSAFFSLISGLKCVAGKCGFPLMIDFSTDSLAFHSAYMQKHLAPHS